MSYLGQMMMGTLLAGLAGACITFIWLALGMTLKTGDGISQPYILMSIALVVIFTVFFWLMAIKRLHDFNRSGWWSLLQLVPYVNFIFSLVLCIVPGNPENNDYGSPRPSTLVEKILAWLLIACGILYITFLIIVLISYKP